MNLICDLKRKEEIAKKDYSSFFYLFGYLKENLKYYIDFLK